MIHTDLGLAVPSGGESLRTDVHRPAEKRSYPVLLLRTPYGTTVPALMKIARIVARHGYAVVLQNVRGRYGSSGVFLPFEHEIEDGGATLRWLAEQPWCDGRVVGWGISYSTYTAATLCALEAPPGIVLSGLISAVGMVAPYHHFYRGGAFVLHWALPWYYLISGPRSRPAESIDFRRLGLGALEEVPEALGGPGELWKQWLRCRAEDDEYWRSRDLTPALQGSRLSMLHLGGWYDFTIGSTLALYQAMAPITPGSQRLIVGPWEHNETTGALFGSLEALERGDENAWLAQEMLGALRSWLGEETPEPGPPVRISIGGSPKEDWRDLESWPPPHEAGLWYLAGGELTLAAPSEAGTSEVWHDPADPVPSLGGRCWAMPRWTSAGPLEQTDTRSDVLTFTSPPLDHPLEIAGNPSAVLWLADCGPVDCCAKLLDVHPEGPEGRATWVADGVTRSSGGGEVTVDLGPVAYRFGQGHRLRLDVAASSFPQFDRTPRPHLLRLLHGGRTPSRLLLPEAFCYHPPAKSRR